MVYFAFIELSRLFENPKIIQPPVRVCGHEFGLNSCVPVLQVKQLAAVQLRKRVTYGWNKVAPDAKEAVKGGLLDVVAKEPSREGES